jgi:hypothetical protein
MDWLWSKQEKKETITCVSPGEETVQAILSALVSIGTELSEIKQELKKRKAETQTNWV